MNRYIHRQDLHTHCTWDDGKSSIDELASYAGQAGLTSLGVSIHTPMPFGVQACAQEKLPAFFDEVRRANEVYAPQGLRIYAGAEWDILSSIPCEPHEVIESLADFDYVIGSVHHITVSNPEAENLISRNLISRKDAQAFMHQHFAIDESPNKTKHMINGYFRGDAGRALEQYYAQYEEIARNKEVDIVGHFDLPLKFCPLYDSLDLEYHVIDEQSEAYRRATNEAMALLVDAGKIFELNTRTIMGTTPVSSRYISWEWLGRLHDMGGRVTIGSDAHYAMDAGHAFRIAGELLRKYGFREIWTLQECRKDGKPALSFMPKGID